MIKFVYIAVGGAAGAGLRYAVSVAAIRIGSGPFPWGTLLVNLLGSLVIGFIWALLGESSGQERTDALFFIGLLGAFTTFSAYTLESMQLYQDGRLGTALVNVLANNVGALMAVVIGFAIARALFGLAD